MTGHHDYEPGTATHAALSPQPEGDQGVADLAPSGSGGAGEAGAGAGPRRRTPASILSDLGRFRGIEDRFAGPVAVTLDGAEVCRVDDLAGLALTSARTGATIRLGLVLQRLAELSGECYDLIADQITELAASEPRDGLGGDQW